MEVNVMDLMKAFKFMKQETLESIAMYQGRPGKNQLDMIAKVGSACALRTPKKISKQYYESCNMSGCVTLHLHCPSCNVVLFSKRQKFCVECGQALDNTEFIPKEK